MGYPARLLGEDERIDLELRPHWKALVAPVLVLLVTGGAAGFLAAVTPSGSARKPLWIAIAVVGAIIVVKWTIWPWLIWFTKNYTITNRRLIIREGVIRRDGRDMPLEKINDVSFSHKSLLERMLGCGTLVVESAGERGQIILSEVPHVEDTQRELYRLIEEDNARRRHEMSEPDDEDDKDVPAEHHRGRKR